MTWRARQTYTRPTSLTHDGTLDAVTRRNPQTYSRRTPGHLTHAGAFETLMGRAKKPYSRRTHVTHDGTLDTVMGCARQG